MEIKEKINSMEEAMINDLARLVKYNSENAPARDGMPFGEGPALVLKEALEIADSMGFKTKNLDNYCGYAEIGEGKDIVGIVAHLDIVPAGDGWNTDPFTLTRKDGMLYGRGVSDDKGAAVASLYTLKLLKESGEKLDKRVRLILGCNEETGSMCMKHYMEVEEPVTVGFTPDANFPGIHGEKGSLAMQVYSKNTKIVSMEGGFVFNAVCNHCTTVVRKEDVDKEKLLKALEATKLVSYEVTEKDGLLTIDATGVAAHASTPLLGINAAGYTMKALADAGMEDDFVDYYNSHIGLSCDGEGYGIKLSDAYGELTLNNGIVKMEDGKIMCTIDCRVPVTATEEQVRSLLSSHLEDEKGVTYIRRIGESLFYPEDSELVKSLYNAYVKVTGDTSNKPLVIGGGTYAKSIPGIIAFGCEWPDADNHIHDANESLSVEEFKLQVEIYLQAVKNLLAM